LVLTAFSFVFLGGEGESWLLIPAAAPDEDLGFLGGESSFLFLISFLVSRGGDGESE
jgi:hypothetical protein